jgi:hypothetical protein
MFYTQCWKCGNRWSLGTGSTCTCPDETTKSEWVGLTDEELGLLTTGDDWSHVETPLLALFARTIETKLKEKNT